MVRGADLCLRETSLACLESAEQSTLQALDRGVEIVVVVTGLLFLATGLTFLAWVHRLVQITRTLNGAALPWTPSQAAWGFVIPIISLFRPYQVLRDTQSMLAGQSVPEPEPEIDPSAAGGYRDMPIKLAPEHKVIPNAVLGWWWGSYVTLSVLGRIIPKMPMKSLDQIVTSYRFSSVLDLVAIVAGVLAIKVVTSLTARVVDLFARVEVLRPEALERAGFQIEGAP